MSDLEEFWVGGERYLLDPGVYSCKTSEDNILTYVFPEQGLKFVFMLAVGGSV